MRDPAPVLVTDAPSNANLAVVRSLGRQGIPVGVCGFEGEFNLSFHSRYVQERVFLPSPARDPSGFLGGLRALLVTGKYPILFPTTDRTIQLVAAHRAELPAWIRVPIAPQAAIETALDKEATLTLARRLGVPTPRTWCPAGPAALEQTLGEIRYPVIVKPRQTNFLGADGRLHKTGYAIVDDAPALARAYAEIDRAVPRPLIQEVVQGDGAGVFSIWDHGTPRAWFAHRRLREEDPRGGRASAATSVRCDPRLRAWAEQLLGALAWHGVAMVEFKWDAATGAAWLMEINGRFWGSLALALAAGADFPYWLYRLANGEPIEAPADYPAGVVARDPIAELKHFVRVLAPGRRNAGGGAPSRWATLRQMGSILHPTRDSYNWTTDDPEPGRQEWRHLFRRARGLAKP
jgi:predicted ATP-grasp superfamily ATP-dependent carboligase